MVKSKKQLIEVSIDGLDYPIKIGKKVTAEGDNTITSISIHAMIEKIYEKQFEENILYILNNRDEYVGLQQLSNKMITYLNSINARTADIVFSFPFFIEKILTATQQRILTKHTCQFKISKSLNFDFTKKYIVEIPVIGAEFIPSEIQKELFEIPAALVVEMDGFDVFFIEDIIDLVEKRIYNEYSNSFSFVEKDLKILLLEKLENDLCKEFNSENCSVKILIRKGFYSYSTNLVSEIFKLIPSTEFVEERSLS